MIKCTIWEDQVTAFEMKNQVTRLILQIFR